MKTILFTFLTILILHSCSVNKQFRTIEGNYAANEKEFNNYLKIYSDSSFIYSIGFSGSLISKCSGKWNLNNKKDSIILNCIKQDQFEALTSTYMKQRTNKFKLSNNKLKDGRLILKKE